MPTAQPSSSPEESRTPRIKVCGLTSLADALATAALGVDWIGLNFHPPSPRCIDESLAAQIVADLPEATEPVGLFVNRPPAEVREVALRVGLRVLQLHGDEPPEDLVELADFRLVRAFRLSDAASIAAMRAFLDRADRLGRAPDAVLIDAFVPGLRGGTGQSIPDEVLAELPPLCCLILSGGLTCENVSERVARLKPWMVDVASGVESAPGRKDPARVQAFVAAARSRR